jgi:hypothetical protein
MCDCPTNPSHKVKPCYKINHDENGQDGIAAVRFDYTLIQEPVKRHSVYDTTVLAPPKAINHRDV